MRNFKRSAALFLSIILILTMIFSLSVSISAVASTTQQSLGGQTGDPLRVDVYDNGSLGLFFLQHETPSDPSSPTSYVNQYYDGDAWASSIFLTDDTVLNRFYSDYADYYNGWAPAGTNNYDIGPGTLVKTDNTVTTTWTLYSGELQFVQTISYIPGNHYFEKKFAVTNLSDRIFTDMKFIHGGDTFFGGSDSARSYWNDLTKMVYVKNNNTTDFGLMGFYGSVATPADRYYAGNYYYGNQFAASGVLPNSADETYVDAGYQLQWNKTELAVDETWTITAYEQITEPSDIQILAPAEQTVARGAQASYDFMVQNFTAAMATFNLTALSEHGWPVAVQEGASVSIDGNGAYQIIHVTVDVPADANLGDTDIITLSAVQSDNAAVTAEGGTRTIVDEQFPSITGITPSATQLYTDAESLDVTVNTNNVADGSEVVVTLLDAGKNPLEPDVFAAGVISTAIIVTDSAGTYHEGFSGIPVPAPETIDGAPVKPVEDAPATPAIENDGLGLMAILTGTATITLNLPGDLVPGTYYLSVAIASAQLADDTTSVEVQAAPTPTPTPMPTPSPTPIPVDVPTTGEQAPWQLLATGLILVVLAGGAHLIRRRISRQNSTK